MQRIQGSTSQSVPSLAQVSDRPLSSHQHSVLEGLITRIVALNHGSHAEVWLMLKNSLGIKNDYPLLSSNFPAAEKFLSQRLETLNIRQLTHQIENLLPAGDNRQRVDDFIQQSFNLRKLDQLDYAQLRQVFLFLQNSPSTTVQPQRWVTQLLLPAQAKELNTQIFKLATVTGKSEKIIRASMCNILGVKSSEQIKAKDYPFIISWLQVQQKLSLHSNITFLVLKDTLRQVFEPSEWNTFINEVQLRLQETPQAILTPAQVESLLHKAFVFQRQQKVPSINNFVQLQYNPLVTMFTEPMKVLKSKRTQATITLAIVILVSCVLIKIIGKGIVF